MIPGSWGHNIWSCILNGAHEAFIIFGPAFLLNCILYHSKIYNREKWIIGKSGWRKTTLAVQGVCGCDRFQSGSIRDVFQTIIKKDGYRGLMRGWIPRMLFHAPAAAICWSTYEASKTFFQELNGSSNSGIVTWTRAFIILMLQFGYLHIVDN